MGFILGLLISCITQCIAFKNKTLFVHRIVAEYFVDNPHGYNIVDHMDGDKTNNHASNLRWCTSSQNAQNRKKKENCASQYIGVYKTKYSTWKCKIKHDGVDFCVICKTELDAAKLYDKKALEFYGPFAKLNFPLVK